MPSFEWPATCAICRMPGRRIRHRVWAHLILGADGVGSHAHAFLPIDVDERVSEQVRDAQWMRRVHRDEVRASHEHEREMSEL